MRLLPDATYVPWPSSALPCPVCRRKRKRIIRGSLDGCCERYQCPSCGWMGYPDYVASVATWNAAVRHHNNPATLKEEQDDEP